MSKALSALLALLISIDFSIAREPVPSRLNPSEQNSIILVLWDFQMKDQQLLVYFKRIREMGAKHIVIPVIGCQSDKLASDVRSCSDPHEPFAYREAVLAQKHGFITSFLPIVLSETGGWRGDFNPRDPTEWFKNYGTWVEDIARKAQQLNMPELVVGTEMSGLYKYTTEWRTLLQKIRKDDFFGPLVMTVNWDRPNLGFWDETDAIGVSAYFPLADRIGDSDAVMLAHAKQSRDQLLALSLREKRPIHITEVGYPSMVTGASQPWYRPGPGEAVRDWPLQARCFHAFFSAWMGTAELMHIGVWALGDPLEPLADLYFDLTDKPAADVIRNYFSGVAPGPDQSLWPNLSLARRRSR